MNQPPINTDPAWAWEQVEQLLEELSGLAQRESSAPGFYAALLAKSLHALAARGGAAWACDSPTHIRLLHQTNLQSTSLFSEEGKTQHEKLLQTALRLTKAVSFMPGENALGDQEVTNPSPHPLVACPVSVEGETVAIVEIALREDASPATLNASQEILSAFCQIAADFETLAMLRALRQRESQWNEIDAFAQRVNQSLSLDRTAFVIANEARTLLGCDRISILSTQGTRTKVLSVSGIDTVDRRSPVVRQLEDLAGRVIQADQPLWAPGDHSQLPPQIETRLQTYLDVAHSRSLVVLPLYEPASEEDQQQRLGAIVAESFDGVIDNAAFRTRLEKVARHASVALDNALAVEQIPMLPALRTLGSARWFWQLRQLPYTVTALIAAVALILFLCLFPASFHVYGRGELTPQVKQTVFAPMDARVESLHLPADGVDEDVSVKQDAVLLELFSDDIHFELAQVAGQRLAAAQELDTLRKAAVKSRPTTPDARARHNEMNARILQLEESVNRLNKEENILLEQQQKLELRAQINGRILDWNAKDLLATRPVRQGQILLTLADVEGPWELEVEVPGKHAGYILQHRQKILQSDRKAKLQVDYILAADPGQWRQGTVTSIAPATTINDQGSPVVKLKVQIDKREINDPRPGAAVVARVYCGQQPLGYVWLHDAIESARTWLLF